MTLKIASTPQIELIEKGLILSQNVRWMFSLVHFWDRKPIPKKLDLENSLDLGSADANTEAVL